MAIIENAPPRPPAPTRSATRRPVSSRPAGAALRHRGTGVVVSRCDRRRHPVAPATTVGLALLAGLITVWLGLVADFGAALDGTRTVVPDRLAVVRVEAGETLPQLAARVAPGAPRAQVVERIRELNRLDSAAVQAGQTLIAPVG